MGITDFHKFIKQHYINSFKSEWLPHYDHVYIDINYCLHYCSYGARNINDIYIRFYKFIENILLELSPTKSIVFGSDGSAPLAKLLLQRKRRLMMSQNIGLESLSLMFTPGTEFMKNLNNKMENFLKYINMLFNVDVIFLQSDIDEAELKLKNKMQENINKYPSDSHIFVTNDADVIVMLATLDNYKNTFIFCKSKDNIEILSMNKLIDLHTDRVGCSLYPHLDFAFIGILMGNDYLPKLSFINYDNIWEAYKKVNDPVGLVNKNNINSKFMIKFLGTLISLMKKRFVDNFIIDTLYHPLYDNYLDGLTWCFDMYQTSICKRYNYMYNYTESPHPVGLLFYISKYPEKLILKKEIFSPINPTLYSILVLPKTSMSLIDKIYHPFIEKNNILYKGENCEKCKYYNKILSCCDENTYKTEFSKLSTHRKQHFETDININDINNIITNFSKYNK